MTHQHRLLKLKEAAALFDLPLPTLRAAVSRGELPALRLSDGPNAPWRLRPADVERWLTDVCSNRQTERQLPTPARGATR